MADKPKKAKKAKKPKSTEQGRQKHLAVPGSAEAERVGETKAADKAALRVAQIANLHLAGYSLEEIGKSLGATAKEIDDLLANDAARYVRSQPQLRTWTRNYLSGKYAELLEAVWPAATGKPDKNGKTPSADLLLQSQDRAMRTLNAMGKLHGADAPMQQEIKIEAAPETVEAMVAALAAKDGLGYDVNIFDVPEEDIHEIVEATVVEEQKATESLAEEQDDD